MNQLPDWFSRKIPHLLLKLHTASLRFPPRDPGSHSIVMLNALYNARNGAWCESELPLLTRAVDNVIIEENEFPTVRTIMDYFRREQAALREVAPPSRQLESGSTKRLTPEEIETRVKRFDESFQPIVRAILMGENRLALALLEAQKKRKI